MKFSLAFLMAVAVGAVNIQANPVKSSSELHDVLDEFLALVPQEKVIDIFLEYLSNDAEVQIAVEYIKSDGFKELVRKVEKIDDVINFYDYLNTSGLDIYGLVNKLHGVIGLPPLVPGTPSRNVRITGGIAGLIEDIKAVLPLNDIKSLYHEKLKTSSAFAQLIERLHSTKFQELINALRANEEFQKIVKFCYEAGVDIKAIKDLLATIFGLEFPDQKFVASFEPSSPLDERTGQMSGHVTILSAKDIDAFPKEKLGKSSIHFQLVKLNLVNALRSMRETRANIKELKSCEINVNSVANLITNILDAAGNVIDIINSAVSQ